MYAQIRQTMIFCHIYQYQTYPVGWVGGWFSLEYNATCDPTVGFGWGWSTGLGRVWQNLYISCVNSANVKFRLLKYFLYLNSLSNHLSFHRPYKDLVKWFIISGESFIFSLTI